MGQLHLFFCFLCRHYLVDSLSLANYYSLHYVKFRETFAHFRQHSTSFFLTMRATSLLASFLRRNFGTRFLNRENNWDCGNSIFPENSLSIAFNSRCQRTGSLAGWLSIAEGFLTLFSRVAIYTRKNCRISVKKYFLAGRLGQAQANQSPVSELKVVWFVGLMELTSLRNSYKRRHQEFDQELSFPLCSMTLNGSSSERLSLFVKFSPQYTLLNILSVQVCLGLRDN